MFPDAQKAEWIPFAAVLFIPQRVDRIGCGGFDGLIADCQHRYSYRQKCRGCES